MNKAANSNLPLIECVVNVSEGQNIPTLQYLRAGIIVAGGIILDTHISYGANRTVFTYVVPPELSTQVGLELFRRSIEKIDLRIHTGEHPRVGALDVFPLIPLNGVGQDLALDLANDLATKVASEFALPIFFYENSARFLAAKGKTSTAHREFLPQIRKGGLSALAERMTRSEWYPNLGPRTPHPSAGVAVLGVRDFLLAFNVTIDSGDVAVANRLAQHLRTLPGVRAIGWKLPEHNQQIQVSCNLTRLDLCNPVIICQEIRRLINYEDMLGSKYPFDPIVGSEVVGLAPAFLWVNCLKSLHSSRLPWTSNDWDSLYDFLKLQLYHPVPTFRDRYCVLRDLTIEGRIAVYLNA